MASFIVVLGRDYHKVCLYKYLCGLFIHSFIQLCVLYMYTVCVCVCVCVCQSMETIFHALTNI